MTQPRRITSPERRDEDAVEPTAGRASGRW